MKTGLVLEGGAMRGMYTAGVLDVMMENQIEVDGTIGVSAGAVFGCNYKSRQIGRVIRYNKKYCNDPRFGGLRSYLKTGDIFDIDFCYYEIPQVLDPFDEEAYEANPMEFYVVCTDVKTGEPVYHKCVTAVNEDLDWMRASASMPFVTNVVKVDGMELLDGGISDSIPVRWFRSIGYKKNIVILTRDEQYRKKPQYSLPFLSPMIRKYPAVIEAMRKRHRMYNRELDYIRRLEEAGWALVIRPSSPIEISKTEKDTRKLEEVYQLGRKDGLAYLDRIKAFAAK